MSSGRRLRILAVTLRYPPYVAGGYELLTRDAVRELDRRGHDVRVLCGRGERLAGTRGVHALLQPDLDAGDPFRRALEAGNLERLRLHFLRPANVRASRWALEEVRPDAMLFFNLGLVSLAPVWAARRAGVPTLGFISDPWPLNHWLEAWRADPQRKRWRRAILERAWRSFRARVGLGDLLCCSEHLRRRLIADGIDGDRVAVQRLGVSPDVQERAEGLRPARRDPDRPLVVACISALWPGKGQDVLLEALSRVVEEGVDVRAWLAAPSATPEFRLRIEARARAAPLAGRVEILDGLSRPALSERLSRSHVLVVPSVWPEPYPLATLEGMAHGLAVVVSSAGGSPEAIVEGRDGLVTPAGDPQTLASALRRLAANEAERRALGEAARRKARTEAHHGRFVDGLEAALDRVVRGEGIR